MQSWNSFNYQKILKSTSHARLVSFFLFLQSGKYLSGYCELIKIPKFVWIKLQSKTILYSLYLILKQIYFSFKADSLKTKNAYSKFLVTFLCLVFKCVCYFRRSKSVNIKTNLSKKSRSFYLQKPVLWSTIFDEL